MNTPRRPRARAKLAESTVAGADALNHAPLFIDVAGLELTAADRARLAHPLVGGVIHFARNWRDRAQLTALNAEIKAIRPDLLICVDHEGGRVQRFRTDGFTPLPSMRTLGELWMTAPLEATNAATALGYVLGAELRACGVDFSFAPVLDLDYGASGVIGDRSFHRDPRVVALLAKSVMHGLLQVDMAHCGKHFPGHGFVKADSHVDVPVDRRSLKAILADDAAPYGWLSSSLLAVMPAHVIYPKVDALPAGFSAKWLGPILRDRLRFMGAVFSDDLSMAGARRIEGRTVGFAEATLAALGAGCDLVLLCNQSVVEGGAPLDALLDELDLARRQGRWQPSESSELRRRALLPQLPPLTWDELMHDLSYQEMLALLPSAT